MGKEHTLAILLDPDRLTSFATLYNDFDLTIFLSLSLEYSAKRPDRIDLVGLRFVDRRIVLGREKNIALARHCFFKSFHAAWSPYFESNLGIRKNNYVTNRNHRIALDVRGHLVGEFLHTKIGISEFTFDLGRITLEYLYLRKIQKEMQ